MDDQIPEADEGLLNGGTGKGAAHGASIATVDNVPGDPEADRARSIADADANIKSAERKVAKQKVHLAKAPKGHKKRQRDHLAGAQKALKEARAARERIT